MILRQLETKRLYLRKFEDDDIDFVYSHFSNSNVSEYLYEDDPPKSIDEAKVILEWCMDFDSENHIRWCIARNEDMIQIGTCGFHGHDKKNNAVEIGYDLSSAYWNAAR